MGAYHYGLPFSTFDRDNDIMVDDNCAMQVYNHFNEPCHAKIGLNIFGPWSVDSGHGGSADVMKIPPIEKKMQLDVGMEPTFRFEHMICKCKEMGIVKFEIL